MWGHESVQTTIALVTRKADVDELSGKAYADELSRTVRVLFRDSRDSLILWFVVIPLFTYRFTSDIFTSQLSPKYKEISAPSSAIIFMKYFMLLVVDVTSGAWIWSSKTLQSFHDCNVMTT